MHLEATWDMLDVGMECVLDEQGEADQTIVLDDEPYCHTAIASDLIEPDDPGYDAVGAALKAKLDAASPSTATYTVTKVVTALQLFYRIESTVNFRIEFTSRGAAGTQLREVLGFDGDISSYGTSHDAFWVPKYAILTTYGQKANSSDEYEPDGISEGSESDDGGHYEVHQTQAATYEDWVWPMEPKASVYARAVSSALGQGRAHSWTFEDFFKHVRGARPFVVVGASETKVHTLRPESARSKPERRDPGFDDWWDVQLRTFVDAHL